MPGTGDRARAWRVDSVRGSPWRARWKASCMRKAGMRGLDGNFFSSSARAVFGVIPAKSWQRAALKRADSARSEFAAAEVKAAEAAVWSPLRERASPRRKSVWGEEPVGGRSASASSFRFRRMRSAASSKSVSCARGFDAGSDARRSKRASAFSGVFWRASKRAR